MMHLQGLGLISPFGRGLAAHRLAWADGPLPAAADGFLRVADKTLKDPLLAKDARRSGRFDRMAILAGLDALADAGVRPADDPSGTGLILATALGPHATTFRFLDDLIRFKPEEVSPTLFSHSVHNAAASYLSLLAGLRGPTLTVTRFAFAFHEALEVAQGWLAQKRCRRVLVGAVDELGAVMERIIDFRSPAAAGRIPLAEGAAFFVLGAEPGGQRYGTLTSWPGPEADGDFSSRLILAEADGLGSDLAASDAFGPGAALAAPAAWFGRQTCPGALSCAAAALFGPEPGAALGLKPERYVRVPVTHPETCLAITRDDRGKNRALLVGVQTQRNAS